MRRCYRGVALALGGVLVTGLTSHDSCSYGSLTVYAAEDTLTEEMETAFQEEVRTEENVETEIQSEETAEEPDAAEEASGEITETRSMEEETADITESAEEFFMEQEPQETAAEEISAEQEPQETAAEEASTEQEPQETAAEEISAEQEPQETATGEPSAEQTMQEVPAVEAAAQTAGNRMGLEEQEYQVLLKIVEAEAGGEDCQGRMLVANVVMNRVRSSRFPNTVTEVVYQRCSGKAQFSPVSDGRIDQVSISQETVEAVARALNGEDASAGALYFRSVHSNSNWFDRALRRVTEHGNHIFYAM